MTCTSPVIVALDYPTQAQALSLVDQLDPRQCRLKVGKELYTREGAPVLAALHQRGFEVFLDLKFHDIPNTVAKACAVAADLGVWMVNVHASGGEKMMQAAREALDKMGASTLLIAVTVLTSMSQADLQQIGVDVDPMDQVMRLAGLANNSGLDGVVCSAQEASRLKHQFGTEFKLVTPGIRPVGAAANDQQRIMTPPQALQAGVDYMVIGRPITQSDQPAVALKHIINSIS